MLHKLLLCLKCFHNAVCFIYFHVDNCYLPAVISRSAYESEPISLPLRCCGELQTPVTANPGLSSQAILASHTIGFWLKSMINDSLYWQSTGSSVSWFWRRSNFIRLAGMLKFWNDSLVRWFPWSINKINLLSLDKLGNSETSFRPRSIVCKSESPSKSVSNTLEMLLSQHKILVVSKGISSGICSIPVEKLEWNAQYRAVFEQA